MIYLWCNVFFQKLFHRVGIGLITWYNFQKQSSIGVLRKRCSENMRQIYRRIPMPTLFNSTLFNFSSFIELALRYGCSPVNLLHAFKISFFKNTYGRLLLRVIFSFIASMSGCCSFVGIFLSGSFFVDGNGRITTLLHAP